MSQPVAQIVAGFAKVFVGEIVEKGVDSYTIQSLVKFIDILQYNQREPSSKEGVTMVPYHQITYARRIECTRKKQGEWDQRDR